MSTPEDQVMQFDAPQPDVEDTDDGGAIIRMEEGPDEEQVEEWFDNIADKILDPELEKLSLRLLEIGRAHV